MWVIYNIETGFSDESMRVATFTDMEARVDELVNENEHAMFGCRWESDEQAVGGEVALAQISHDGKWNDYARATPEQAIAWAQKEPAGQARVVDWVDHAAVIWP